MADHLVWVDCEMTGLDLGKDALIEIAALVTDANLNVLGDGVDVVIHADDAALDGMPDVVREMHAKSGLTDEVRHSTVTMADAERQVLDYVRAFVPDPRAAPLAGNSIATDRGFITRDMPALDAHLHYRMVDVSSIKELCRRWFPRIADGLPVVGRGHPHATILRPAWPVTVGVAQLVEHWVVVPGVAGSIPVTHPVRRPGRSRSSGPSSSADWT